jgi:hypothetical protein
VGVVALDEDRGRADRPLENEVFDEEGVQGLRDN